LEGDVDDRESRASGHSNFVLAFCSPLYEDVAINELSAVLGARLMQRPAHGVLLLSTACDTAETVAKILAQPPIFTRQVLVDIVVLNRNGDTFAGLTSNLDRLAITVRPDLKVCDASGRCPPELAELRDTLALNSHAMPTETMPQLIVVTARDLYIGQAIAAAGITTRAWLPAGRPDLPYDSRLVSRSALKLIEAIELFDVPLRQGGKALDLGAAPGGWSQILARHGMIVTSVDPGELDPRVASLFGVTRYPGSAQDFLHTTTERYDIIVNDMRLDARLSARTMTRGRQLLEVTGAAVMTLKLPERAPTALLRQALDVLSEAFPVLMARCLYFNRNEVTVYAPPVP
jgi:23S rRNA C2498 (ribose-2'-O)-methylase RlmM